MQLVLLHALPFDERMWAGALRGPDTVAPTLYGLGHSVQDWARAVLSDCRSDELLVVGSSVGGSCALEMARAAPDQVRDVVLVGAKATVRRDLGSRDEVVRVLQIEGVAAAWSRFWAPLFGAGAAPEIVAAARQLALEQDVDNLIVGVRAFHERRDHSEFLPSWSGRVLLITGADDRAPSPQKASAGVERTVFEQLVVADCGHYVPLEQPDLFRRVIERRLRDVPSSPSRDPSTTLEW